MEAAAYLSGKLDEHEAAVDKLVVFEQPNVFIHFYHPGLDEDKMVGGTLSITELGDLRKIEWEAYKSVSAVIAPENETQILSGSSSAVVSTPYQEITSEMRLPVAVSKESPEPDWTMVADGPKKKNSCNESFGMDSTTNEAQDFQYDFSISIEDVHLIKKSKKHVSWNYLILELCDGASLPPLHFHQGGCEKFLKVLEVYLIVTTSSKSPQTLEITSHNHNALNQSFDELNLFSESPLKFPAKILQHPMSSAFSGFSRVTNFLQDMLNPAESPPQSRPAHERAAMLEEDATEAVGSSRIQIKQEGDGSGAFEVITCANLGPRLEPPRQAPITVEYWNNHKDDEGRVLRVDEIKLAIFKGGVDPTLRKEVWKYLLNYYEWNMTRDEIKEHKHKREDDYFRMKLQWKSVTEDQESRFTQLKDHKSLIEKDVTRTDRTRLFYEGQENVSLKLLHDILITYVMYNFDLGYVQGMSDILSPILELMGSEVDAFWCFVGFMNIIHLNFEKNQNGIKRQLRDLRTLIQFLDPKLFDNLAEKDSNNLYFCFRWLLLRFKREFSFEDIQTLWEVMWTELPCPNYHLLICVALLDSEKQRLMEPDCGFTEILKHINELSGKIDLESTLRKAEGIYEQLSTCRRDLSDTVRDVLGLSADS